MFDRWREGDRDHSRIVRIEEAMEKSLQMMMSTRCGESDMIDIEMGMTAEGVGMGITT